MASPTPQPIPSTTQTPGDSNQVPDSLPRPAEPTSRAAQAEAVIRKNVFWALGAGVLPLPLLDVAAVTAVELKLFKELSDIYEVKFSTGVAKKIIYSLMIGAGLVGVGSLIGGSLAKLIPGIGTTLGAVSVPVLVGAYTHSMGRVLMMHFEAGGTLLDFDPAAMRTYFKQEFEKAKETVSQLHKKEPAKASHTTS